MNDFDKTFVVVFNNSFLKIELNCDKDENMLISDAWSFQKRMLFKLKCSGLLKMCTWRLF